MGKQVKWRYWGFSAMDNKAAQAWLNDMAARGWALEGIYWDYFAKFVPAREEKTYFVDWADGALEEEESYLVLCRDAGWGQVTKQLFLNIYCAKPGTTPIQTDPAEEYARFKAKVAAPRLKAWAWILGIVLAFAALLLVLPGRPDPIGVGAARMLADPMWTVLLACAPVFLAVWVFRAARLAVLWRGWRESARTGAPLPTPSPAAIRAGCWGNLARDICILLALLGMMLRFICGPGGEVGRLAVYAAVAAAAAYGFANDPREKYRRTAKYRKRVAKGFVGLAALTIALHVAVGPWLVGRMPAVRPAELLAGGYEFYDEAKEVERRNSFLIGYADWGERFRITDGQGRDWNTAFSRAHWTCAADWTADAITWLLTRGMEPVEGRTGVWRGRQGDFDCCVVRRGSAVERISHYTAGRYLPPEAWWSALTDAVTERLDAAS